MPKTRFTIYDAMENNGFFASNSANAGSMDHDGNALYTGPVEYPKMLYHPQGEEKIIVPAEMVLRAGQYVPVGEQRELINMIVNNSVEEKAALAEGWLDHPAKAMRVRVENIIETNELSEKETKALLAKIPKISISINREAELLAEIAKLKAEKLEDSEAA